MQPTSPITVIVALCQNVLRMGMKSILTSKSTDGIKVIAEANDGSKLSALLKTNKPSVLILEFSLPLLGGLIALKHIKEANPGVKVIMLVESNNSFAQAAEAMEAGANSCISKAFSSEKICDAVKGVHENGDDTPFFNDLVNTALLERVQQKAVVRQIARLELTDKETTILKLMCEEKSTKEIADTLDLSPRTVEAIRDKMKTKTGAKTMAGLIMFAVKSGLFKPEEQLQTA